MSNKMTQEEMDLLDAMFNEVDQSTLTGWDARFFADQRDRYERFGVDMFISPKQWVHLKRIHETATELGMGEAPHATPDDDDGVPF